MANKNVEDAIKATIATLEDLNTKNVEGKLDDEHAVKIVEFLDAFNRIDAVEDPPKPTTAPPGGKKWVKERDKAGVATWVLTDI